MSLLSKATLGAAITFTVSIVTYVHYKQNADRQSMKDGVVRDIQRQEMRKIQNLKQLQDQIELTKMLKEQKEQNARFESSDGRDKISSMR